MITIVKQKQPGSLVAYIKNGGTNYLNLDKKTRDDIIDSLLKEQGELCAYCMRRIPRKEKNPNKKSESDPQFLEDRMRIEHLEDRNTHPNKQLLYTNMLAVCPGYLGGTQHCDRSKSSNPISLSPLDPRVEASISYKTGDGTIKSSNPVWDADINSPKCLNLNCSSLKAARKMAIEGLIQELSQKSWTKKRLQQKLEEVSHQGSQGKLPEFVGIMRYFLRKRISKM